MSRKGQLTVLGAITGASILLAALAGSSLHRATTLTVAAQTERPRAIHASAPVTLPASLPLAQPVLAPSFADIAERAIPSIVAIQNTELVRRTSGRPQMPFDPFQFFFGDPERRQEGQEDQEQNEGAPDDGERKEAAGSGFLIQKDGYILTNYHVVAGATKLMVTLSTGERLPATIKGKDESIDLALIKIEPPRDLAALPLGDSNALRTGEWVIAIGNPLGYEHSVTVGVVSGKGRPLAGLNPEFGRGLANYIQTDAAINFGNSGGPLLNARGEVIGINTAITRNYPGHFSGVVQGIGFALPIDQAKAVLDQLMTTGRVARGYLSIQIEPVDEARQKYFGIPEKKGAFVQKVNEDGPAARAGVRNEDIIISVDGKQVDTTENLIQLISGHKPGDTVNLGLFRCRETGGNSCDGHELSVRVKLADRTETLRAANGGESDEAPGEEDKPTAVAKLGFSVTELTPSRFREMNTGQVELPRSHPEGVLVTKVDGMGPAYDAGLQPGQIITQVGRDHVATVADFQRAAEKVQKGQIVRLAVTFYLLPAERGEAPGQEERYLFFEAQ